MTPLSTPPRTSAPTITHAAVLALRQRRQRLDARRHEPLPELLDALGGLVVPGGCGPYAALHARDPRHTPDAVAAALRSRQVACVPVGRGEERLVSARARPLFLTAARRWHERQPIPVAAWSDAAARVDVLEATLAAVGEGARTVAAVARVLRRTESQARWLVASLLAEGRLELSVRDGRLDQHVPGCGSLSVCADRAAADGTTSLRKLAAIYFDASAPASLHGLALLAGCSLDEAAAAAGPLSLRPVLREGSPTPLYMPEADLPELRRAATTATARVLLLPAQDPIFAADETPAHGLTERHADTDDETAAMVWHHQPLVAGSVVAGLWRWDARDRSVELRFFAPPATRPARAARVAAEELSAALPSVAGDAWAGETPSLEEAAARWSTPSTESISRSSTTDAAEAPPAKRTGTRPRGRPAAASRWPSDGAPAPADGPR